MKESCIAVDERLYHRVPKADPEHKQAKAYFKFGMKQRFLELSAHAFGTIAPCSVKSAVVARSKALDFAKFVDEEQYSVGEASRCCITGRCEGDDRRESVAWTARGVWRYSGHNYATLDWDSLHFWILYLFRGIICRF